VGVASLRAMARAVPASRPGVRCAVLDARRAEVFVAGYAAGPRAVPVLEPLALLASSARETLEARLPPPIVWIGSGLGLLGIQPTFVAPGTAEPAAGAVGLLAEELDPTENPALPLYIRDAGATLPNLGAPAQH
jgi:tRNA A37 threonylcarbamoyladenosine modification protein TsaB